MTTQLNTKYLHSDAACWVTMKANNVPRFFSFSF